MKCRELDLPPLPPLPKGFVEWARRRGFAEPIARGEKDLVEALKEWEKEGRPRIRARARIKRRSRK